MLLLKFILEKWLIRGAENLIFISEEISSSCIIVNQENIMLDKNMLNTVKNGREQGICNNYIKRIKLGMRTMAFLKKPKLKLIHLIRNLAKLH